MAEQTIKFRLEVDEAGAVNAFGKLTAAQRKAIAETLGMSSAGRQVRQELDGMGQSAGTLGQGMASAAQSMRGLVGSMLSISGAVALLRDYKQYLGEIHDLQSQLSPEIAAVFKPLQPLAEQSGAVARGQAGMMDTFRQAAQTAQAGGVSLETAAGVLQSVLNSFTGRASQQDMGKMANMLAASAGKGGAKPEEAAAIAEFLSVAGANTADQFEAGLAEIQGAMLASVSLGMGGFGQSAIKGGAALMQQGATSRDVLALMTQARQVSGGSDEAAAELLRQVSRQMLSPEAEKIIAREAGVPVQDAANIGVADRFEIFGEALRKAQDQGPKAAAKFLKPFDPRESQQIVQMFAPAAVKAGELAKQRMDQFGVNELRAEYEGWKDTAQAKQTQLEVAATAEKVAAAEPYMERSRLGFEAKKRLETLKATGQIPWYDSALSALPLMPSQEQRVEAEIMSRRIFGEGYNAPASSWEKLADQLGIDPLKPPKDASQLTFGQTARALYMKPTQALAQHHEALLRQMSDQELEQTIDNASILEDPRLMPRNYYDYSQGALKNERSRRAQGAGRPAATQPAATQPAATQPVAYNYYGDHYYLHERGDPFKPGRGGPQVGIEA